MCIRDSLETSNLAQRCRAVSTDEKKCKIRSKGVMREARDPLLEFWDPPNISGINEARNFKFGSEMDGSAQEGKKFKITSKGSCGGHVTHFWNFSGTPNISGMNEARKLFRPPP